MIPLDEITINEVLKEHTHFKALVQRCNGISNDEKLRLYKDLLDIEMKLVAATMPTKPEDLKRR